MPFDDGSCCYVAGCMDNSVVNYNVNACQDDGSVVMLPRMIIVL